jgi:cytochrome c-type biogenesis protein CcmH/NrfG
MSRLADRLMRMDKQAPRPQGVGGIPSLSPAPKAWKGIWRLVVPLVIVGTMGVFATPILLRPPTAPLREGGTATRPNPAPVAKPVASIPAAAEAATAEPVQSGRLRARALVDEGLTAARDRDFEEANRLLTRALDLDPADADAWNGLGVVLIRQGEITRGVGALRRALRAQPSHAEAHRNLAVALDGQGRCREAALHYRSFLSQTDGSNSYRPDVTRRLGELESNGRVCE